MKAWRRSQRLLHPDKIDSFLKEYALICSQMLNTAQGKIFSYFKKIENNKEPKEGETVVISDND